MGKDYKETLNLPKTDFPMKANLVKKEKEILAFWEQNKIYHKMIQKDRAKSYMLHDGPPYANGHIHLGHTLNKILKDIIVKYKSMKGYYVPFVPGWDCHGLPIEHQVDKKLGSKKDQTPVLEKRRLCREYAEKFIDIQREEFKRLGVFGDWERPYITMDYSYEAAIVREFNRFVKKGAVYKGKKPVHWCPTCVTALAEAEVEYSEKESPSIYVKFRLVEGNDRVSPDGDLPVYFVIWTTTPWTLPANMALALHPEFRYKKIKTDNEYLIVAEDLIDRFLDATGIRERNPAISEDSWTGRELEGLRCSHPWIDRRVITIVGEHVTLEQGTGVVHTAPGHGEEDFEIGLKYGLDVYAPVDDRGRFTQDVEHFSGMNVFKANDGIIEILKQTGTLVGSPEVITHSYPHCWRCKRPVIFRATEQWFISMDKDDLRKQALEQINKTKWIPAWGRDRIYNMVENRPDWCISRQRAWGVPITLIQCVRCNEYIMDEEIFKKIEDEIEKKGADVWFEMPPEGFLPHGYKCHRCGGSEFSKETDILDVWFDSGVSHAAVMERDERLSRPADLYLEGSDQHRGWFQSSLLASVGTRGDAPYRAVLTHGFVVDGQGKKMSKSLGNVISPQEITERHGAEILRLWSSSADYREDMRISDEIISRLIEAYRKIRNTCRFLLGNISDLDPSLADTKKLNPHDLDEIDQYIMSILQRLIERVNRAYENFSFHEVYHSIYNFCVVDMSSFYLDILKDRLYTFKKDSALRRSSQIVLYNVLISITKMIAPILSFTAEEIWSHLPGKKEESVFLSTFPEVDERFINPELEETWKRLIRIRDEVNKALEIKRKEKYIGNSLEAGVILLTEKEEIINLLERYRDFLPTLFIVSSVEVNPPNPEGDVYESEEVTGLRICVTKAKGSKCQRCWNWDESVGTYNEYPDVCTKCYQVLTTS